MVTFRDGWKNIADLLKSHSVSFGIDKDNIVTGDIKVDSQGRPTFASHPAPYIQIFAMPDMAINSESNRRISNKAEIGILIALDKVDSFFDAICDLVELAEAIEDKLNSDRAVYVADPILDIVSASASNPKAVLTFFMKYKQTTT